LKRQTGKRRRKKKKKKKREEEEKQNGPCQVGKGSCGDARKEM
jgi:hypothetical protein